MFPSSPLSTTYAILTAMLAPALFLTATSSLLMSANGRLARISDRLREELGVVSSDTKRIDLLKRRADLALKAIQLLHLALSSFVLTSLAIALDAAFALHIPFLPTVFAVLGVAMMLLGSLALWREARLAVRSLQLSLEAAAASRATRSDEPSA